MTQSDSEGLLESDSEENHQKLHRDIQNEHSEANLRYL